MRYLLLHPNMPGQYKHLAPALARRPGAEVVFITEARVEKTLPGVRKIVYPPTSEPDAKTHRYVRPLASSAYLSQSIWRICHDLKRDGFTPDLVIGHLGWGQGLFVKDVWPDTPVLSFFEFYYGADRGAANFLPGEDLDEDGAAKLRLLNAQHLFNLVDSDWGIVPTAFQMLQHPPEFHAKMSLLHDGVDTDVARPDHSGRGITLPSGVTLGPGAPVVTYVARNFEPYRGFPTFVRAAKLILERAPDAHIVCVGADGVSYGRKLPDGVHYRRIMREEINLNPDRVHFVGYLDHHLMIRIMQISSAHIYLTVPFVLSWSLMEAMSTGCVVVGSDTPPVREVIVHGQNGLLVDFFDHEALADQVCQVLANPRDYVDLREAARRTIVSRYSLHTLLPLHLGLVDDLAARRLPPPTQDRIKAWLALHDADVESARVRLFGPSGRLAAPKTSGRAPYIPDIEERVRRIVAETAKTSKKHVTTA